MNLTIDAFASSGPPRYVVPTDILAEAAASKILTSPTPERAPVHIVEAKVPSPPIHVQDVVTLRHAAEQTVPVAATVAPVPQASEATAQAFAAPHPAPAQAENTPGKVAGVTAKG